MFKFTLFHRPDQTRCNFWSLVCLCFFADFCDSTTLRENGYYRAMLCIARTMSSQDVRPSVRPSVTRRYCVKMPQHCSFSYTKRYGSIPTGIALSAKGVWKNRNFRSMSHFISETTQDTTIVTMECNQETVQKLSNDTIFSDFERLCLRFKVMTYYMALNRSETVRDTSIVTVEY